MLRSKKLPLILYIQCSSHYKAAVKVHGVFPSSRR